MDITKCQGATEEETCPMRETCWRFKAPDSGWQSYFTVAPLYQLSDDGEWKCDEYWKTE